MFKYKVLCFVTPIFLLLTIPLNNILASTCSEGIGIDVFGPIYQDTTWKNKNKIYCITQSITVLNGVTLSIEPGVIVKFWEGSDQVLDDKFNITIDGTLVARGTNSNKIIFTSAQNSPEPGDWEFIKFTDSSVGAKFDQNSNYLSGSILQHAVIEYGGDEGITISCHQIPYLDSIIFRYNYNHIYFKKHAVIKNSTFNNNSGNHDGLVIYSDSSLKIFNSNFNNNLSNGYKGIIFCKSELDIHDSEFNNNDIFAARSETSMNILNSSFTKNNNGVVIVENSNYQSLTLNIIGSTFHGNSGPIIKFFPKELIFNPNDSKISIYDSKFYSNSGRMVDSNTENELILKNSSFMKNTGDYIILGKSDISNCQFFQNDCSSVIKSSSLKLSQCLIYDNNATHGIEISKYSSISNSTIVNNSENGIYFNYNASYSWVSNNNNIFGNERYDIYNNSSSSISASNNFWGTAEIDQIFLKIFDKYDDQDKGEVDFGYSTQSFLTIYCDEAPPIPPIIEITPANPTITLSYSEQTKILPIAISNIGESTLHIDNIFYNTSNSAFQITSDNCTNSNLQKLDSCTIQISFSPATYSLYSGTIEIQSNAVNNFEKNCVNIKGMSATTFENEDEIFLPWKTGDEFPWLVQSSVKYSGENSIRSAYNLSNNTKSVLYLTVETIDGLLSFQYKVSSENAYDFLIFKIDDVEKSRFSGEVDWSKAIFDIAQGTHKLEWIYSKDSYKDGGADCCWIDDVYIPLQKNFNISPAIKEFGNIALNTSNSQKFTITNTSFTDISLNQIMINDEGNNVNFFNLSTDFCSFKTIQPFNSCTFSIIFSPTLTQYSSIEIIVSKINSTDKSIIPISGTGFLPTLSGKVVIEIGSNIIPVANATIEILDMNIFSNTDSNGLFQVTLPNFDHASYNISIGAKGLSTKVFNVSFSGDNLDLGDINVTKFSEKISLPTIIEYLRILSGYN